MAYIGVQPADKYTSFAVQHFTTSATTSYTLDNPVANENEIALFINNVRQQPGSSYAYTASGTSLTLSAATSASDTMYCVFIGKAVQTVTPATGSVTNAMLSGSIESSKLAFASYPYRNLIINGDMSIAQRGTSSSGITGAGYHSIDRWQIYLLNLGTWTMSQETDVPTGQGFSKSLKFACTTADATPASSDQFYVRTKFEGQNLQHLKYGTSNAEKLTLSFWVKCNKTTTATVALQDHDNSKMVTKSYTINSANTWEKKTVTFNGNTSNTFTNDNNLSLDVRWWLDSGSDFTSGTPTGDWEVFDNTKRNNNNLGLADSTSNVWYITGVQLEVGTTASDFEFIPYDVNKRRCERYLQYHDGFEGVNPQTHQFQSVTIFRTEMRANPSASITGTLQITDTEFDFTQSSASVAITAGRVSTTAIQLNFTNFSGMTRFRTSQHNIGTNNGYVLLDSEL